MGHYSSAREHDRQGQRIVELEQEVKMWKDHNELLTKTIETLTNNYERELKDKTAMVIFESLLRAEAPVEITPTEFIEKAVKSSFQLAEEFVFYSKKVNNDQPKAS